MAVKVNIAGAGVYGLAVGCYLQMNGFDTEIFEMHDQPGGLCTTWTRKGYSFDACIHWLMGSSPKSNMHQMWKELGAVQGREFVEWDAYAQVRTQGGERFTVYTDPDKLEAEMLRVAPEDASTIRSVCHAIRRTSKLDMIVTKERVGLLGRVATALPWVAFGPTMKRWASIDIATFASRLRSPVLAEVFRRIFGSEDAGGGMPTIAVIMMLGFMHKKSCGYPIGGSLAFARAIERRYRELGGRVHYGSRVERILVEDDRAVGLVATGKEYRSDEVISCIDGRTTLYDLLGGKYLNSEQRAAYESFPLFPALIYVSLGIDRDLSTLPHMCVFPLPRPISLEDGAITLKQLAVRFFTFDPAMAPPGKTTGEVMIESWGIEYWRNLREHEPKRYREEKSHIAELVVDALDAEFGDIKRHVEVTDVATPVTWERYTGNWKGSYEGFLPTGKTMMKHLGFAVPRLENFSMHSQWVSVGGGLPPAGTDGRALAQRLCKKYGKRFRATVPEFPGTGHGPGPEQQTEAQLHAPATE